MPRRQLTISYIKGKILPIATSKSRDEEVARTCNCAHSATFGRPYGIPTRSWPYGAQPGARTGYPWRSVDPSKRRATAPCSAIPAAGDGESFSPTQYRKKPHGPRRGPLFSDGDLGASGAPACGYHLYCQAYPRWPFSTTPVLALTQSGQTEKGLL